MENKEEEFREWKRTLRIALSEKMENKNYKIIKHPFYLLQNDVSPDSEHKFFAPVEWRVTQKDPPYWIASIVIYVLSTSKKDFTSLKDDLQEVTKELEKEYNCETCYITFKKFICYETF